MSESQEFEVGAVSWFDLTVENAGEVKAFYEAVVGWKSSDHDMGDYCDFSMETPEAGRTVAGVCHSRGANADLPPHWLVYVNVADVDAAAARCTEHGGAVRAGPRDMGENRVCVIQDPAGAVLALIGPAR